MSNRELAGYIGVDAGLCWVGDPCYVFHKGEEFPKSLGKDWGDFCDKIYESEFDKKGYKSFGYDLGHEGLGVLTSTGYGDGSYPVYITRGPEGRIAKIEIEFMSDEEDSE